jgi:hypothetical protein
MSKMARRRSTVEGSKIVLESLGSGTFGSCAFDWSRKTEMYSEEKCELRTELLPLCGTFPVSRAAQETKNAFILWKGRGAGRKQKLEDCAIMAFSHPPGM